MSTVKKIAKWTGIVFAGYIGISVIAGAYLAFTIEDLFETKYNENSPSVIIDKPQMECLTQKILDADLSSAEWANNEDRGSIDRIESARDFKTQCFGHAWDDIKVTLTDDAKSVIDGFEFKYLGLVSNRNSDHIILEDKKLAQDKKTKLSFLKKDRLICMQALHAFDHLHSGDAYDDLYSCQIGGSSTQTKYANHNDESFNTAIDAFVKVRKKALTTINIPNSEGVITDLSSAQSECIYKNARFKYSMFNYGLIDKMSRKDVQASAIYECVVAARLPSVKVKYAREIHVAKRIDTVINALYSSETLVECIKSKVSGNAEGGRMSVGNAAQFGIFNVGAQAALNECIR